MAKIIISDPFAHVFKDQTNQSLIIDLQNTDIISDGYHTFGELYDHRITLWIALLRCIAGVSKALRQPNETWRSKQHHPDDTPMYVDWFVLGMGYADGRQITYHLPLSRWDETQFAETLDHAPKFDGHTPADTIERLKTMI
jgi:hypothetical protein